MDQPANDRGVLKDYIRETLDDKELWTYLNMI